MGRPQKRGERENLNRVKHSNKNGHWFGPEAKKWLILIGLSAIVSILLFPNVLTKPRSYKLGDVADRDIKASRELLVENDELTEKNRQEAVKDVLSVYDFDQTGTNIVTRVQDAFSAGRDYLSQGPSVNDYPEKPLKDQSTSADTFKQGVFEILDVSLDEKLIDSLVKSGFPKEAEEAVSGLAAKVLKKGIVINKAILMQQSGRGIILHDIHTGQEHKVKDLKRFYDLQEAKKLIKMQSQALEPSFDSPKLAEVSVELAAALMKPNLTFNKRETELRKDLARKSVKPFYFKVKKGEMLVREGERIQPEHLLKLTEENKSLKHNEMLWRAPAMALLIAYLLSAIYLVGLLTDRSSRAEAKGLLFNAVTLLAIFLVAMVFNFVAEEVARGFHFFSPRAILFAAPIASGAMLVSVFQGMRLTASFSLIISVLAAFVVGADLKFFLYFFISSLVAGFGVRNCRERGIFIKTGLKVSLTNIILALAVEALHGSLYSLETLIACAGAFMGGILVGVIATGILPLFEMSFGFTTDIKLLELANLDQPLLKELMVQSPGTYHHSVIVSNMVEATAKAVKANPLLSKVAAYYHDIGKMRKPLYFIENQRANQNRHEKLAPSMSSLILISHVKDGVELAKKHRLGSEIIDIIRQHHGTSLITFFYEKAKEQREKKGGKFHQAKEEDFRYPGPKPQTKEAGLVMLADAVEAASRTLVDPTVSRIQGMVQKIINKVFSDGQLDECELTLKDLHEIAKSFNKTLSGIFHHRVEYPESVAINEPARKRESAANGKARVPSNKGDNGDTDQLKSGDSRPKKPEDKTETGESLKRLGLS
ncbi:MAG: HDIG domain-containing protein [Desulfobacteraceae bacterium]|nr:MAG: HDIG domain-containing protein [Desulfobacteraceae bacterium]